MRTTVTFDPDVTQILKRKMARKKQSLKRTVNEALRFGLSAPEPGTQVPFTVKPHPCHFKPGIDMDKLNRLADELEDEAIIRKLRK